MSQAKISAIITTFNRATIVSDAIASALAQTHPVHELIVVDDGSSDGTEDAVRAAFAMTTVPCRYVNKTNGGMATALNRGITEATGDWIAFLDDDDLWSSDHLQRCTTIIARHPELESVSGLRHEQGALQSPPADLLNEYEILDPDGPILLKRRAPLIRPFFTPVVGTSMVRKHLFDKIRFDPEAGARLDLHFFWRLSQLTGIALDLRTHGVGRQFRTSLLSTDDQAPQPLKDEITLKRNRDELRMLQALLCDTNLPPNHRFHHIFQQTLLGRSYLLRSMGRYREALLALRACAGECKWWQILKEAALCLVQVRPRHMKH